MSTEQRLLRSVNETNKNIVFHWIRKYGPQSYLEIAKGLSIKDGNITSLKRQIQALKSKKFVIETEKLATSSRGPRSKRLIVSTAKNKILSFFIDFNLYTVKEFDVLGNVLAEKQYIPSSLKTGSNSKEELIKGIQQLLEYFPSSHHLVFSTVGSYSPQTGILDGPLLNQRKFNFKELLEATTGSKVSIYNDLNSQLYYAKSKLKLDNKAVFVLVHLRHTFLSIRYFENGREAFGSTNYFGHVGLFFENRMFFNGTQEVFMAQIQERLGLSPATTFETVEQLFDSDLTETQREVAEKFLLDWLKRGLIALLNLLDPEVLILSGVLGRLKTNVQDYVLSVTLAGDPMFTEAYLAKLKVFCVKENGICEGGAYRFLEEELRL